MDQNTKEIKITSWAAVYATVRNMSIDEAVHASILMRSGAVKLELPNDNYKTVIIGTYDQVDEIHDRELMDRARDILYDLEGVWDRAADVIGTSDIADVLQDSKEWAGFSDTAERDYDFVCTAFKLMAWLSREIPGIEDMQPLHVQFSDAAYLSELIDLITDEEILVIEWED